MREVNIVRTGLLPRDISMTIHVIQEGVSATEMELVENRNGDT